MSPPRPPAPPALPAGALLYVRLLAKKAESAGGGQGGPPTLIVPVILFMALNRWNALFADDYGFLITPIPMLLGFFQYKPASLFQAGPGTCRSPRHRMTYNSRFEGSSGGSHLVDPGSRRSGTWRRRRSGRRRGRWWRSD